ncbi:hypothetical protein EUGRSUZ_A00075 [Eucalyptus grandis]|uniref:Uncharacterized protein n=2 Tax=Eucalyptus grandis TaxID=71139 RepID=A0ACC3LZG0_EUCGR|nr:hypothetical protein EUGRSUZ_A00075 [Eucalyptus grandis]
MTITRRNISKLLSQVQLLLCIENMSSLQESYIKTLYRKAPTGYLPWKKLQKEVTKSNKLSKLKSGQKIASINCLTLL